MILEEHTSIVWVNLHLPIVCWLHAFLRHFSHVSIFSNPSVCSTFLKPLLQQFLGGHTCYRICSTLLSMAASLVEVTFNSLR